MVGGGIWLFGNSDQKNSQTAPPAPVTEVKAESSTTPATESLKPASTYVATEEAPPKRTSSSCDSNYTGCVPIASDVDCSGGRGNGPAYVSGPVSVIGSDIYDLDRDGDGVACE